MPVAPERPHGGIDRVAAVEQWPSPGGAEIEMLQNVRSGSERSQGRRDFRQVKGRSFEDGRGPRRKIREVGRESAGCPRPIVRGPGESVVTDAREDTPRRTDLVVEFSEQPLLYLHAI